MKITLLPKARYGKFALALIILCFILFVIGSVLPWKEGYSGIQLLIHNLLQTILTILIFAAGIMAAVLGTIAVVKNKERSIIVYLVIIAGIFNMISFIGVILNVFSGPA